MRNASHLTPGHDPVLAAQIAKTWPGMAHWAASGPPGQTCADCDHLGYWRKVQDAAGNIVSTRRCRGCAKFFALTGRHGPVVPKQTEACRYFAPRDDDAHRGGKAI